MTPADDLAVKRAFAALDELADQWAEEVGLTALVANVANADNREGSFESLMRLAFQEGTYRARMAALDTIRSLEPSIRGAIRRHVHTTMIPMPQPNGTTHLSPGLGLQGVDAAVAEIMAALSTEPPPKSA